MRLALALLLAACGADPECGGCPEDAWSDALVAGALERGEACPVPVRRASGGCLYRDVCGRELWLSGCVAEGVPCEAPDFSGVTVAKGE